MLINEDYFNDLEIEDEDIIDDDTSLDVEELTYEMTEEELRKQSEQYDHFIRIRIVKEKNSDTTFFQTSLLPRIFKRLDSIFDMYSIEHSQYALISGGVINVCNTINYQLFCQEEQINKCINNKYKKIIIDIYVDVNYPKFTYKRAFRFIYTVINLLRIDKHIDMIFAEPPRLNVYVPTIYFYSNYRPKRTNYIAFGYYYNITHGNNINLCNKLTEEDKEKFYDSVSRHFFGDKVKEIDYKAIDRDVPLTPLKPL